MKPDGTLSGSEFLVNTYTTDDQRMPEVAALNDGGFAIAWQSRNQDGDNWGIYSQMFDPHVLHGSTASIVAAKHEVQ